MVTTIQVSESLLDTLKTRKMYEKESYEEVIWDMVEDSMTLSAKTKKNIAKAEEDIKRGRVHRWEDIKKEFKINV